MTELKDFKSVKELQEQIATDIVNYSDARNYYLGSPVLNSQGAKDEWDSTYILRFTYKKEYLFVPPDVKEYLLSEMKYRPVIVDVTIPKGVILPADPVGYIFTNSFAIHYRISGTGLDSKWRDVICDRTFFSTFKSEFYDDLSKRECFQSPVILIFIVYVATYVVTSRVRQFLAAEEQKRKVASETAAMSMQGVVRQVSAQKRYTKATEAIQAGLRSEGVRKHYLVGQQQHKEATEAVQTGLRSEGVRKQYLVGQQQRKEAAEQQRKEEEEQHRKEEEEQQRKEEEELLRKEEEKQLRKEAAERQRKKEAEEKLEETRNKLEHLGSVLSTQGLLRQKGIEKSYTKGYLPATEALQAGLRSEGFRKHYLLGQQQRKDEEKHLRKEVAERHRKEAAEEKLEETRNKLEQLGSVLSTQGLLRQKGIKKSYTKERLPAGLAKKEKEELAQKFKIPVSNIESMAEVKKVTTVRAVQSRIAGSLLGMVPEMLKKKGTGQVINGSVFHHTKTIIYDYRAFSYHFPTATISLPHSRSGQYRLSDAYLQTTDGPIRVTGEGRESYVKLKTQYFTDIINTSKAGSEDSELNILCDILFAEAVKQEEPEQEEPEQEESEQEEKEREWFQSMIAQGEPSEGEPSEGGPAEGGPAEGGPIDYPPEGGPRIYNPYEIRRQEEELYALIRKHPMSRRKQRIKEQEILKIQQFLRDQKLLRDQILSRDIGETLREAQEEKEALQEKEEENEREAAIAQAREELIRRQAAKKIQRFVRRGKKSLSSDKALAAAGEAIDQKLKASGKESSTYVDKVSGKKVNTNFAAEGGLPVITASVIDLIKGLNPKEDYEIIYTMRDMQTRGFKSDDLDKISKMIGDKQIKRLLEDVHPSNNILMGKVRKVSISDLEKIAALVGKNKLKR